MSQRILVVDDEESIRLTFSEFLSGENYDTENAEDFNKASNLLLNQEFDAVFLDIMLGRENGLDLLKLSKENNPNCPVIMVTGGPDVKTASEALRCGAFDYLAKPVGQEELLLHAKRATDYKKALDKNDQIQKRMAAVFEGIEDGILIFDSECHLIDINQAAKEILGFDEAYIDKALPLIIAETKNEILKALEEAIMERVSGELYRVELQDVQGKTHFIGACLSPLSTVTGKENDFVLTLRDQTLPVKEVSAI